MDIEVKQLKYNVSKRNTKIRYIVIHDTGNPGSGANADSHFAYFNGGDRGSSADFFVDDTKILQVNDYNKYYTWHCGDGHGQYGISNVNSVGIEICINSDGNYDKAFQNAIDLTKYLMKELNIQPGFVVRHYDASRKTCPASMVKNNWALWNKFKILVESEGLTMTQYEELKGKLENKADKPFIYNYIDDNMPDWAKPTIQKLVDKGILKGGGDGLNLTEDLMRILVINDRAGLYD